MIAPTKLIYGHYECRNLNETMPVLTELLGLEVAGEKGRAIVMKHPNTDWRLMVREGEPNAANKPLLNHYGVRVRFREEIDRAFEYLTANKEKYHLAQVHKPKEHHVAYSFFFLEPGGNYWECEYHEPEAVKEVVVYGAPWKTPYPEEKFPGKGYVPQGLTHGTLECDNKEVTVRFLRDVLGLEIIPAPGGLPGVYVKHHAHHFYVVVIPKKKRVYLNENSRLTLQLESSEAVREAHREFSKSGKDLGITKLGEIRQEEGEVSFSFSDPDRNWWELAASGLLSRQQDFPAR